MPLSMIKSAKRMNMERTSWPNAVGGPLQPIETWKQISRYESNSMKPQFVHVAGINHRKTSTLPKENFVSKLWIPPSSHHCTKIAKKAPGKDRQEKELRHDAAQGIQGIDWLHTWWIAVAVWATIQAFIMEFFPFQTCSQHVFSLLILARKSCIRVMESKFAILPTILGTQFPFVVNGHVVGVSGHVRRKELQQQLHRSMPGLVVCVCATRHAKSTTDVKTSKFWKQVLSWKLFSLLSPCPGIVSIFGCFFCFKWKQIWVHKHLSIKNLCTCT